MAKAQSLATAFGAVSAGIGVWYALAPRHFLHTIGAPATPQRIAVTRLVAGQEMAVGTSLFADGRAGRWLSTRVAGDIMHAGMLALAYRAPDTNKARMRSAFVALAAITAADIAARAAANRVERTGVADDKPTGTTAEALEAAQSRVYATVTVSSSPDEAYAFWRDVANLPRFMKHLEDVQVIDDRRSVWTARAPFGGTVEWEAEITDDRPGERIAWSSRKGSDVWNTGEVTFRPAPGDRGTEVRVRMEYAPPGGPVGALIARVLGEEPQQQVSGDLRRFKQVLETGEVVVSEAVAEGRSRNQRPAQPLAAIS
jgi:uncharacterized membrane protein